MIKDEAVVVLLMRRVVCPWLLRKEEFTTETLDMPLMEAAELDWLLNPALPFPSN